MRITRQEASICLFFAIPSVVLYVVSSKLQELSSHSSAGAWVQRLLVNILGYSVILVPGYLIIKYIRRINYIDSPNKGCLWKSIKPLVFGSAIDNEGLLPVSDSGRSQSSLPTETNSFAKNAALLLYCFSGLQTSYLMWGLFQEKIMTQQYNKKLFTDSQVLVFMNRIFALVISGCYLTFYDKNIYRREGPAYKYSYCALTNILSSWFQYEALKFVSFPTQVLAKACKIIPVMIMGKIVSRKSYEYYEYVTAVMISFGMVLFLSGSSDYVKVDRESSLTVAAAGVSGLIILILYMVFDSFTSNWQSHLFQSYQVSSMRMMFGVNIFAVLLTGTSIIHQGSLSYALDFASQSNEFMFDCLIQAVCSSLGQLFIYYTIEKFGPVVFIIIMTIRQALAVLLSCIFYHHPVTAIGIVGVLVIFVSLILRIYCAYRIKQLKKPMPSSSSFKA